MNYDEFAFFNQQLASMLREGIPLEGALKHLAAGMRKGPLRAEVQLLEADLARGTPLKDALPRRSLPDFYRRMVELGARTNDLPGFGRNAGGFSAAISELQKTQMLLAAVTPMEDNTTAAVLQSIRPP